jgi:hypothetical protein
MKKISFSRALLMCAAWGLASSSSDVTYAQAKADFSGTWKLVETNPPLKKSGQGTLDYEGGGSGGTKALEAVPPTIVINQSGNELTFESTMSDGWVRKLLFKLDFTLTDNPLPEGGDGGEPRINGPTKTRGRWLKDGLYLHLTQGLGQRRDVLNLNDGALTIRRDWETPGGSDTMMLTYKKVS